MKCAETVSQVIDAVSLVQQGAPGKAEAADLKSAVSSADAVIIATPGLESPAAWGKVIH